MDGKFNRKKEALQCIQLNLFPFKLILVAAVKKYFCHSFYLILDLRNYALNIYLHKRKCLFVKVSTFCDDEVSWKYL